MKEQSPFKQVKIAVKVLPNASRNEIGGRANAVWRVKIAAPPDKGKANKELVKFLSERLNVKKTDLTIIKGQTSHNKVIAIDGLDEQEVVQRLAGV